MCQYVKGLLIKPSILKRINKNYHFIVILLFLFFPVLFILVFFSKPLFSPESLKYCVVDYVSGLLVIGVMELKCFAIFNF